MKTLVLIFAFVAVATAQFFPGRLPSEEQYAASLGGAPVGLYDKKHGLGHGPYGGSGSEVVGASLGGAKVGLYGKEHQQPYRAPLLPFLPIRPAPLPYVPIRPAPYVPIVRPALPILRPGYRY